MKHIGDERIIEALKKSKGFISAAAALLGCNRTTISKRIDRRPAVRDAYEEIVESRLDVAESKLMFAVDNGQPWAIQYILDNQGGRRGYGRREIAVKAEADVRVGVLPPEDAAARIRALAAAGASAPAVAAPAAPPKALPAPRRRTKGHATP